MAVAVSITSTAPGAEAAQGVVGPRAGRAPASAEQPAVGGAGYVGGDYEPLGPDGEWDGLLAYHCTYEGCVESIMARGLLARAEEPGDPVAVYLFLEEGEAAWFCEEWGRDTVVEVDVGGIDCWTDPDLAPDSLSLGGTDYVSAFYVGGSIGPQRIVYAYPSYLCEKKREGFDGWGNPKDPFYDGS